MLPLEFAMCLTTITAYVDIAGKASEAKIVKAGTSSAVTTKWRVLLEMEERKKRDEEMAKKREEDGAIEAQAARPGEATQGNPGCSRCSP